MSSLLFPDGGAPNSEATISARETEARRLYPPPAPPLTPSAAPNAEVAAVRAARAADPASVLYPPMAQYGSSVNALALASNPEGSTAELAQQRVELAEALADVGFDQTDVGMLATLVRRNTITPPTPEQFAANRRESIAKLRQTYGAGFDRALADAKAAVQLNPNFLAYVAKTGLETDPWLVMRAAELGKRARTARR